MIPEHLIEAAESHSSQALEDLVTEVHYHGILAACTYGLGRWLSEKSVPMVLAGFVLGGSLALRYRKHKRMRAALAKFPKKPVVPEYRFVTTNQF